MVKSWIDRLSGHRALRTTSSWVVKHTNSRTVAAWLCIDLFISLGLGVYYFFFRYVSSLGWVPLQMMNNFKFYILVAGLRATCTLWGIFSVLRRNVRNVKRYYTVFLINLLVAVWLMVPILSMDCGCTNYYQCEALQSFALDGASLNKLPQPKNFGAHRKVPYVEAPPESQDLSLGDMGDTNSAESFVSSTTSTIAASTATTSSQPKAVQAAATQDQQVIDDAKKLAAAAQSPPHALLQSAGLFSGEPSPNEVEMLDDLLSSGHPRLVEKKRRRWKEASLLQLEDPPAGLPNGQPLPGTVSSPVAAVQPQLQPVPGQQVPGQQVPGQQVPQQLAPGFHPPLQQTWVPVAGHEPVAPGQVPVQYYAGQAAGQPPHTATPQQVQMQATHPQIVQPGTLPTHVVQSPLSPVAYAATPQVEATTATTTMTGTTTPAVSAAEKAEKMTANAFDVMGNNFKVLTFFNRVRDGTMIQSKSGHEEKSCISETRQKAQWTSSNNQMDEMLQDREVEDRDSNFLQVLGLCIESAECYGIRWKLEEVTPGELYNSTACTLSKPASEPNKSPEEQKPGIRTFYLTKNVAAADLLVRDPGRRARLMSQILEASSPEQAIERTKELYTQRCRCDSDSCRSYADDSGNERGWCYVDEKSLEACYADGKSVFVDAGTKKKWTRDICHKERDYTSSCQCSGIGMVFENAVTVDEDVWKRRSKFEYGSDCEQWNGAATKFSWCYVGWDTPCVDRRRDERVDKRYEGANVPAQYWSMVACDKDSPNKRIRDAADHCENLEYVADGVCLLHLFLSMPMVAVLYNYISNQCGDDFQTEEQFAVQSSSDDEDDNEDEFQAGQATDKGDEDELPGDDAASTAVPKFAGDDASKSEAAKES